jgi:hypothetical protein
MTNTVYGPYSATSWIDNVTAGNHTTLNNLETQASIATHGFGPDLLTPFVLSGITCTKDGTTATQLDIASGRAYVKLSDNTVGLIVVGADNTHVTATPSSTYHLYLQPDGTWYWSTSNSPAANSLHICDVPTDGSGNISSVTDQRTLNTSLLSGAAGDVNLPAGSTVNSKTIVQVGSGNLASLPVEIIVVGPDSTHLPAAGVKGRIGIVVPFSLP